MKTMKAWRCNLKGLTAKEYSILRDMCHASKNVYNSSLYNIRQHYFQQEEYLRYEANYRLIITRNCGTTLNRLALRKFLITILEEELIGTD